MGTIPYYPFGCAAGEMNPEKETEKKREAIEEYCRSIRGRPEVESWLLEIQASGWPRSMNEVFYQKRQLKYSPYW